MLTIWEAATCWTSRKVDSRGCRDQCDPPDCEASATPGSGKCPAASAVGSDLAWPARLKRAPALAFGSGGGRGDGGGALGVLGGGGGGLGEGLGDGSDRSPLPAEADRVPVGGFGDGGGRLLLDGGGGGGRGEGRGDRGGRSKAGSLGTTGLVLLGGEAGGRSSEGSLGITTATFFACAAGGSEALSSSAIAAAAANGDSGCISGGGDWSVCGRAAGFCDCSRGVDGASSWSGPGCCPDKASTPGGAEKARFAEMLLAAGGSDASASRSPESTCSGRVCSCDGASFAPCTACAACDQGILRSSCCLTCSIHHLLALLVLYVKKATWM